ncbi:MAG: UDP-N-acetylmuramate dehydrogenase [Cellulosilyticaceae bacterium]
MDKTKMEALLSPYIPEEWIKIDEPMRNHTTFKIGGGADLYVSPSSPEQVAHIVSVCKDHQIPYYVIGNGSNLLVSDRGYRGVIIEIFKNMAEIEVDGKEIKAGAGATLARVATVAQSEGLGGMEFAQGIPGTIGGGVCMNAGAYGGEMKDIIKEVTVLDQEGNCFVLSNEALALGYRTSRIQKENLIVLAVTLKLTPNDSEAIKALMRDFASRRKEKQPLEFPSAGSTFKRPEGYFAGKLIMDSDLRGCQIGGARVSDKHCGFVINQDGATCEDVLNLIRHVQNEVKTKFDVVLEPEVRIIGEF